MLNKISLTFLYRIIICFFCIIFSNIENLHSQNNDGLIKAHLTSAEQDLRDKQFRSALRNIEKAKELNSGYTSKMHYLSMKAYIGLRYFDDARSEIKKYFDAATEQEPNYNEMLLIITKIDDIEEKMINDKEVESQREQKVKNDWEYAKRISTLNSYENFVKEHPNAEYTDFARSVIDENKIIREERKKLQNLHNYKSGYTVGVIGLLVGIPLTLYGIDEAFVKGEDNGGNEIIGALCLGAGLAGLIVGISGPISASKGKKEYKSQKKKVDDLEKNLKLELSNVRTLNNNADLSFAPGLKLMYKF